MMRRAGTASGAGRRGQQQRKSAGGSSRGDGRRRRRKRRKHSNAVVDDMRPCPSSREEENYGRGSRKRRNTSDRGRARKIRRGNDTGGRC